VAEPFGPLDDALEVRVVWAHAAESPDLEALLDDGERARLASLRRADDRRSYLAAHTLARLVVSQFTGLSATTVLFAARCPRCGGSHGKPHVVGMPQLHLSLSHAAERVAVAVTTLGPVGVDVEAVAAAGFAGFADVALTAREREPYRRLPSASQPRAAASLWVRKEALVKATGDGIFVPPDTIEVANSAARVVDLDLGSDHVGCVAVLTQQVPVVRLIRGDELLAASAVSARTTMR
jgi:4'-phosphopantetheinyl transferase